MLVLTSVLMLALVGCAQPLKLAIKQPQQPPPPPPPQPQPVEQPLPPPPQPQSETYYSAPLFGPLTPAQILPGQPLYQQPEQLVRQESGVKGAAPSFVQQERLRPQYAYPVQPQALAYVIIRPIQPQYQYMEPLRYEQLYPTPIRPLVPVYRQQAVKGGPSQAEIEEQQQQIEQQHEEPIPQQPQPPPPEHQEQQMDYSFKGGKFLKLKNHLDQLKAKFSTMGSSYQVVSEETVQPAPPPPPPQQPSPPPPRQLPPQQPIQQIEQQHHEEQLPEQEPEPLPQQQELVRSESKGQFRPEDNLYGEPKQKQKEFQQQLIQAPVKVEQVEALGPAAQPKGAQF